MEDRIDEISMAEFGKLFADVAGRVHYVPETPAIKKHTNGEMIHEMLERGYAVMKIPSDGKLKAGGE